LEDKKKLDAVRELLARQSDPRLVKRLLEKQAKKHQDEHYVQYWQPTAAQIPLIKKFTADKKIFGILGGNRSGKTELGAYLAVVWFLGKEYFRDTNAWEFVKNLPVPEPPNNIWVVGLDFPTLRDVIWREKFRYGREHPGLLPKDETVIRKINETDYQVFGVNGSIITGKSADSGREKFQGASVDLVWIDEEPEVDVFDECYQRTIDCSGKILLTLTPLTDTASGVRTPWVFDLYEDSKKGSTDSEFVQLSVLDNPYVPDLEKEKLLVKWAGHVEEKARLYGSFVQRSGLVYNMWNPKLHMVEPFVIPREWKRVVSLDPAATGTTAAVWGAFDGNGNMFVYREYYDRDKVVSEHAKGMLLRNAGEIVDIWLIDPKWGAQRAAADHKQNYLLYREAGIPVRLAEVDDSFGLNVSLEYMNSTVTAGSRHPRVFFFNDLHNFRYEVEHYVWDSFSKGDMKGLSKEKPRKRSDHLMNSWQYLCAGRFKGKGSVAITPEQLNKTTKLNSYT
jgi:phage terminase large subunit-like protein